MTENRTKVMCDNMCEDTIEEYFDRLCEGKYLGMVWQYYRKEYNRKGVTLVSVSGDFSVRTNIEQRESSTVIRVIVRYEDSSEGLIEISKERMFDIGSVGANMAREFIGYMMRNFNE